MKKTFLCLLALLFALSLTAVADGTEILQKDLLSEDTTLALSVNDFVTDSEYPYETVGYFLDDIAFTSEDTAEVTITFTGNYGSNEYFFSNCYIPIYNYETGKLLDIFYSEVELKKPFATSSRTSITREISLKDAPANIYKIKVLMLESLSSLRPNCPVPYLANELVIAKGDIGATTPTPTTEPTPTPTTEPTPTPTAEPTPTPDSTPKAVIRTILSDVSVAKNDTVFGLTFAEPNILKNDSSENFNAAESYYKLVTRNNVNIIPYQGLMCDFTLDVTDEENWKLLSVTPSDGKNFEVVVDPAMLATPNNYGYVEYYKTNDDDKTTRLKLSADIYGNATVTTYKNMNFGNYGTDVLAGGNSKDTAYRYVDTNADGIFDTVFVDQEQIFIVDTVNATTGTLFRDTSLTSGSTFPRASLKLDSSNNGLNWSITDTNGNKLELEDITAGDVIILKESEKSTGTFYDIIVSNETVEGLVVERYEERSKVTGIPFTKYVINDTAYSLLADYMMYPALGDQIIAKIYNGKIVGYEVSYDHINYGLIIANDHDTIYGQDVYSVQLLNKQGTVVTHKLAEKVNEVEMTGGRFTADFTKGTLIAYTLDTNDKINAYDVTAPATGKNGFVVPAGTKFDGNTDGIFEPSSGKLGTYYITEDTVVFTTGEEIKTTTVGLGSIDFFNEDTEYNYSIIADSNKVAKAVVLYNAQNAIDYTDKPFVVVKKSAISIEGQTRTKLTGYVDGEETSIILSDNMRAGLYGSKFAVGDIILYSTNTIGDLYDAKWLVSKNYGDLIVADNSRAVIEATGKTNSIYNKDAVAYDEITLATSRFTELNREADWDVNAATTIAKDRMTTAASAGSIKGYGAVGVAYRVQGNLLRVLDVDNYETTFTATGREYDKLVDGDEKLITDITINSNAVAYYYNAQTGKYKVSSIMDAETDYINADYKNAGQLTNDDFVYVYCYDGDTKLIVVVDVNGDNY